MTMIFHQPFKSLLISAGLAAPCLLGVRVASAAVGDECSLDADCGEGAHCEKESWVNGCNPDAGECDNTVHESETGRCVQSPVECATDADCGEYEGCVTQNTGACWVSSDGSSGCDEVDEDAPKYCGPKVFSCETDDDCPREFACTESTVCLDIACVDGEECAPCSTSRECYPKQIECETDDACPSDWSCVGTSRTMCSGGGSSGGTATGGGTAPADPGDAVPDSDNASDVDQPPEPADQTDPAEPTDEPLPTSAPDEGIDCVEVKSVGYCQPSAWGGSYIAEDGVAVGGVDEGAVGAPSDPSQGDNDNANEEPTVAEGEQDGATKDNSESAGDQGGCSVAQGPTHSSSWLWMALLTLPFMRRRSVARPSMAAQNARR